MKLNKAVKKNKGVYCVLTVLFLLSVPSSSNYMLKSYELDGSGATGESTNYKTETNTAPIAGEQQSAAYSVNGGLLFTQHANVSTATLTNGGNWYNKLLLSINDQNNPTDAQFSVAISTDNFVTTNYVQSDHTVGASLGNEDWMDYTAWGAGSGDYIVGLTPGTTYTVKIKSRQGDFTEGPWGPNASGSTSSSTLSFDIDIAPTDSETASPYTVSLGSLSAGSVTTATDKIWIDFATNAENGGFVYIYDAYTGLRSTNVNYTIGSSTTNLTAATEGYGIQVNSTTGLNAVAPYDGSSNNIGIVDTTIRAILDTGNVPVTSGRSSINVKAKSATQTPAANDYVDTLTVIATGSF